MNRNRTPLRRAAAAAILAALAVAGPAAAQAPPPTVTLKAPPSRAYGKPLELTGAVTPPAAQPVSVTVQPPGGAPQELVAGTTRADGTFRLDGRKALVPGQLVAHAGPAASAPVPLTLRPRLTARWSGTRLPGGRIALTGRLAPAAAGTRSTSPAGRDGRFRLRTRAARAGRRCTRVQAAPRPGYAKLGARQRCIDDRRPGAGGRLARPRRPLPRAPARPPALPAANRNASFGADTRDAVYAFQKIERLARTGVVGPTMWNALARAHTPRASRGGTHIEVHKRRQVLFEVHRGRVKHVVNTSTGLTGNTPLGRWRIYRKDAGTQLARDARHPVLHRRLRGPRLPLRAALPGEPRLRPRPALGRARRLLALEHRRHGLRALMPAS